MVLNTLTFSIMKNNISATLCGHTAAIFVAVIIMLIGTCSIANAQKYAVYSVTGKAYMEQGGKFLPLPTRKYVTKNSRLKITSESAVTILDEAKLKMYSFTREGTSAVGELIELSSQRTKSLTKQYMGYLVKQLFDSKTKKMAHPDTYMQVTGTSYRAVSVDSLFMARIVDIMNTGATNASTPEKEIVNNSSIIASDLDVTLELVDPQTGKALPKDIKPNTACYVRVRNNTNETLYVNVLNIDAKGNKYLVLPMDEEATCSNLLVPASCTVGFKTEPFITSDIPSEDAFLLVATEEPVNFSILMNDITAGKHTGSKMRVGMSRVRTSTK